MTNSSTNCMNKLTKAAPNSAAEVKAALDKAGKYLGAYADLGFRTAFKRGRHAGELFKVEGRNYGKVHGHYPSNPYHHSDTRCAAYDKGYEEGFNGQ